MVTGRSHNNSIILPLFHDFWTDFSHFFWVTRSPAVAAAAASSMASGGWHGAQRPQWWCSPGPGGSHQGGISLQDGAPQWKKWVYKPWNKPYELVRYIYHKATFFRQLNAILGAPSCRNRGLITRGTKGNLGWLKPYKYWDKPSINHP